MYCVKVIRYRLSILRGCRSRISIWYDIKDISCHGFWGILCSIGRLYSFWCDSIVISSPPTLDVDDLPIQPQCVVHLLRQGRQQLSSVLTNVAHSLPNKLFQFVPVIKKLIHKIRQMCLQFSHRYNFPTLRHYKMFLRWCCCFPANGMHVQQQSMYTILFMSYIASLNISPIFESLQPTTLNILWDFCY